MDTQDVARRILAQRMSRFTDNGPDLRPMGGAHFRHEGARLRVAFASLAPRAAHEAVARVLRYAGSRGFQVHWVVVPERPGEVELPDALAAARFRPYENLLLMAHRGLIAARPNPAIAVSQITTWQAMWQYEYGSRQNFFDDPEPAPAVVSQRARDRWREHEYGWCRYYAATLGGQMAGGCYVSLFEDIPTIMGVYTVPAARRQGVATALLARTVADLTRPDREHCCLFVKRGNPAERLYRELEFVPLLHEDTYLWDPA
jgi:GNAT superfamily N-acetyltransferase